MALDRLRRDEQRFRDLAVAAAVCHKAGNLMFPPAEAGEPFSGGRTPTAPGPDAQTAQGLSRQPCLTACADLLRQLGCSRERGNGSRTVGQGQDPAEVEPSPQEIPHEAPASENLRVSLENGDSLSVVTVGARDRSRRAHPPEVPLEVYARGGLVPGCQCIPGGLNQADSSE